MVQSRHMISTSNHERDPDYVLVCAMANRLGERTSQDTPEGGSRGINYLPV